MNQEELKNRCRQFLAVVPLPVTKFSARLGMSRSAYYSWMADTLKLSEKRLQEIDRYLSSLGF